MLHFIRESVHSVGVKFLSLKYGDYCSYCILQYTDNEIMMRNCAAHAIVLSKVHIVKYGQCGQGCHTWHNKNFNENLIDFGVICILTSETINSFL